MNEPRLLDRQQNVPAPSLVKGAEIVALIGLQVEPPPPPGVGVRVGVRSGVGVEVRAGVVDDAEVDQGEAGRLTPLDLVDRPQPRVEVELGRRRRRAGARSGHA